MPDEYLGEDALRVSVTPVRVAYLFRAGDRLGFSRAVQEASSRWAGVTEPIIPVRRGGKVDSGWRQLTSFANVSTAVNVDLPPTDSTTAAAALGLDCVPLANIDRIHSSANLHWSAVAEPQFQVVGARSGAPLWEQVAAGHPMDPTDGPSLIPVRQGFGEDAAGRAQLHGQTVLDAGLAGYGEYSASGGPWDAPFLLWLTKPNSLLDCLWFWNFRALRPQQFATAPMALLPRNALYDWIDTPDLLIELMRREFEGEPDAVLFSHSLHEEEVRRAAQHLKLRVGKKVTFSNRLGRRPDHRVPPFTYLYNIDPREWLYFERQGGYSGRARVQRFRGRTIVPLNATSLQDQRRTPLVAPVMVRLSDGYLANLPRLQAVANLVEPNSRWRGDELEVGTIVSRAAELAVASPAPELVLNAVVGSTPGTCKVSDKGQLGSALFDARDCSILLRPNALDLIKALTTPRSKELLRELRAQSPGTAQESLVQLARSWGGRAERRYRPSSQLGPHTLPVLEEMVAGGWAERGLQSNCSRCGVQTFVPLNLAGGPAKCLGCGAASNYRGDRELQVMYRLDSLVDRASDQGVLPHVAAAVLLRQAQPETHLHLGMEVEWPEGDISEVDLYGYMGREVVCGEVKVSPSEFTDKQIRRDVALSSRLGATLHVMASAGRVDSRAVQTATTICAGAGLRLLVLAQGAHGGMNVEHRS